MLRGFRGLAFIAGNFPGLSRDLAGRSFAAISRLVRPTRNIAVRHRSLGVGKSRGLYSAARTQYGRDKQHGTTDRIRRRANIRGEIKPVVDGVESREGTRDIEYRFRRRPRRAVLDLLPQYPTDPERQADFLKWGCDGAGVMNPPGGYRPRPEGLRFVGGVYSERQLDPALLKLADARSDMVRYLQDAQDAMERHRTDYRRMRKLHERGVHPGLPFWDPRWTREEFDIEHLRQAMYLSWQVWKKARGIAPYLRRCAGQGMFPVEWQRFAFERGSTAYPESVEQAMVDAAPRDVIRGWLAGLPADPSKLAGPFRTGKSTAITSPYPNEHFVEYPGEMEIQVQPDLEPYDSVSLVNPEVHEYITGSGHLEGSEQIIEDHSLQEQIMKAQPWALSQEAKEKLQSSNQQQLRSHMC